MLFDRIAYALWSVAGALGTELLASNTIIVRCARQLVGPPSKQLPVHGRPAGLVTAKLPASPRRAATTPRAKKKK